MKKIRMKKRKEDTKQAEDKMPDTVLDKVLDKVPKDVNISTADNKKIHKISRLTLGIIIGVFIALLVIFLIIFRINFMVGEQLRITISPEYSEVNTVSPAVIPFVVDTKLYNKFVCDAVCTYTMTDISHNIILDSGTFNSKAYKNKKYSFDIPLKDLGYGINSYLYRVECTNIRTAICPSSSDALVRKSLMVINYYPSDEQVSAADFTKKTYASVSSNIVNTSILLNNFENAFNTVPLSFEKKDYNSLKTEMNALNDNLQGVVSVWAHDDYLSAKAILTDNNLLSRSIAMLSTAYVYNSYLANIISNHNSLLSLLQAEQYSLQSYRNILSYNLINSDLRASEYYSIYAGYATSASQKLTLQTIILKTLNNGNVLIQQFNTQNYTHDALYKNVSMIYNATLALNTYLVDSTYSELGDLYPSLYVYSNILCAMNVSPNTDSRRYLYTYHNNVSQSTDALTFCGKNYALSTIALKTVDDASSKLDSECMDASLILSALLKDALPNSSMLSYNDSEEMLLMQYKLLIDYESLNGNNNVIIGYMNDTLHSLVDDYNISDPYTLLSNHQFNISQFQLRDFSNNNAMLSDIMRINILCVAPLSSSLPKVSELTSKYYAVPIFNSTSDNQDSDTYISIAGLPEIIPQCCMYGKCQACYKTPSKNPLILLHGHSFNQDTHAYQSIEVFNGFEQNLSNDKSYFQTGILLQGGNSTAGILGHYYIPPVIKPTYYLETYNDLLGLTVSESKTGNIDTYALRLKESIDYTMFVTGSTKVDIVAHSMGGLVVRRYMQIFGTKNIGTVILVATPNQGISDRTYGLCKIFGALNECDDMRSDGIFIKKLNDFSDQPDIKNIYLVIGSGCDTDGLDGDGIVTANNSMMLGFPKSHVLYVKGVCSGTTFLHNELLDINKYPEVYEYVKSKLGN